MGAVNCKPTLHPNSSSSSAIKAQKPIEKKQKKSFRSFLRAVLLAKKRSNKISPVSSQCCTGEAKTPTILDPPPPTSSITLQDALCKSDVESIIECAEVTPESSEEENFHETEDLAAAASVKFARLRKERYREHALAGLKKVAMLKKKVKFLEDLQKRHMMELKLLSALRISATTSPRDTELEARVNASIEKLSNTHRRFERKLYKTKRKRAITEAKLDLYLIKLSPKLKYTDIHAKNDSFYLSPIQEESEAELEQEQ